MNSQKEGIIIRGEMSNVKGVKVYFNFCPVICGYAKIYTLSDKVGNVFYVGFTMRELKKRLSQHLTDKSNIKKYNRIAELNFEVFINSIEQRYIASPDIQFARIEMYEREIFWIAKYKELGYNLCNNETGKKNWLK